MDIMTFKTWNTTYTLEDLGDGGFLISGHAQYCPEPTRVTLDAPVVVGRCVQFAYAEVTRYHDRDEGRKITTTPVLEVHQ